MIGDDVEVTVLSTHGGKVRLGIQAPSDVPVYRTEIYMAIQQEHPEGGDRGDAAPRWTIRCASSTNRPSEVRRTRSATSASHRTPAPKPYSESPAARSASSLSRRARYASSDLLAWVSS